jgi:hypothetical protein
MIATRGKGRGRDAPLSFFSQQLLQHEEKGGHNALMCFFFTTLIICHNPNIGFTTKFKVQGPMTLRVCLSVKHTFTNGGRVQGMKPNDSQVFSHIGSCTSAGVANVQNHGSPFGTPTPNMEVHLGVCEVHSLTIFALPGTFDVTPGSFS